MRLRDLELLVPPHVSNARNLNCGAYPLNEGTRLVLAAKPIQAPFVKIAPSMHTDIEEPRVVVVDSICLVDIPVSSYPAPEDAPTYARHSLEVLKAIDRRLGWTCPMLVERYEQIQQGAPPCVHEFRRLTKTDRKTKVVCSTHFEAVYLSSVLSVQFHLDGVVAASCDVLRKADPLWFEDEFPLHNAMISDGHYVIRDRRKAVLASVKIPSPGSET